MAEQERRRLGDDTLLFTIQSRLEEGIGPILRPSEAGQLLQMALDCDDSDRRAELLDVFRRLGGLDMVKAALSDFD